MLTTILSAIAIYISTGIDSFIISMILFANLKSKRDLIEIILGELLCMIFIILISIMADRILQQMANKRLLGFLGIIPIIIGIKEALSKSDDLMDPKDMTGKRTGLFISTFILMMSISGDNVGVFIPYFLSLNGNNELIAIFTLLISVIVFTILSYGLSDIKSVSNTIKKYEKYIVPMVLIGLGLFMLYDDGVISHLINTLK